MNFYNFVLDIEEKIKKLMLKKSNKIFPNIEKEIDYNLIDEYFKSNIKLNKVYNNPIIKLNFIKNTKNNNTLIFCTQIYIFLRMPYVSSPPTKPKIFSTH